MTRNLPDILNWRRLSDLVTTSGQPTDAQLADIHALGVTHVINLGPHHNTGALEDEAGTVAALGMTYIYIPVEFEAPTEQNYADFKTALADLPDTGVHVHCIYNARVSAFFYRYAKDGHLMSTTDAFENMDGIWRPGDDWAELIGHDDAKGQPNRYKGDEY